MSKENGHFTPPHFTKDDLIKRKDEDFDQWMNDREEELLNKIG